MTSQYIGLRELSEIAAISPQRARFLCQSVAEGRGQLWRGHRLEVRTFHGRGGRSGVQYQVKVSSLPEPIQERLKALQTHAETASTYRLGDDTARFERAWKYEVIKAALASPKGSSGRKAAIDSLHGQERLDWNGQQRRLTKTTLYKWIEIYEGEGIYGLSQRVRSDKGEKKVFISRAWSDAVPFSDIDKETIAEDLVQHIRGLIAKGTTRKIIHVLAAHELRRMSGARGYTVFSQDMADKIFAIPDQLISAEARFKAVYDFNFDRKKSEDNKPRIQRTIAGLLPMEIVVMDVHHINVMVRRPDGSVASPKFLAFHDVATNRVFGEIIFFNERGGVRNVDVIEAFKRMCQHPAFGLPQTLYCDNGSEYRFADYLEDALKLNCRITPFVSEDRARVIRAKPYNASAKVVEGFFRQLNQQYVRHVPGWIDDNRMNPKRRELGKAMPPFEDGIDAFCKLIFSLLTTYELIPQAGALAGKSPSQTFAKLVADGWSATALDDSRFYMAFSKPEKRALVKHAFDLDGRRWTCPELDRCFERTVIVYVPAYHGFNELLVETASGQRIGWAKPSKKVSYLDPRGAQHSASRDKDRRKAIRDLQRSVPDIDVLGELIAIGEGSARVTPNPASTIISVGFDGGDDRAIVPTRSAKQTRQQQEEEQQRLDEARALFINAAISGKGL